MYNLNVQFLHAGLCRCSNYPDRSRIVVTVCFFDEEIRVKRSRVYKLIMKPRPHLHFVYAYEYAYRDIEYMSLSCNIGCE